MTGAPERPAEQDPPVIVTLPAEIDLVSSRAVTETLIAAVCSGPAVVVADLTSTRFCDCAAVRSLRHAASYAAAHGTDLRLVVPPGPIRRILHLIGLDGQLHLYPAVPEALTTPQHPPVQPAGPSVGQLPA